MRSLTAAHLVHHVKPYALVRQSVLPLPIARLVGKLELGQNRPTRDRQGVVAGLSQGAAAAQAVAASMNEAMQPELP